MKKGILLVNLGTPDSPSVRDVRQFLREFLMDPLVVDMPLIARWLLVNGIVVPFRGSKSAAEYQRLWTEKGSPLKVHSEALFTKMKERMGSKYSLAMAMRYQSPTIVSGLQELRDAGCEELLILPLFPQYAEATSLSVFNKVADDLKKIGWSVKTKKIYNFATDTGFINALASQANSIKTGEIDHTVFSYHGLPERQLEKMNSGCLKEGCCDDLNEQNNNCYRAQCYATSRALAEKNQFSKEQYSVCFQSRQGNIPWIQPYVDDVISDLAKQGHRKINVFSPAFVADCLETTIEIGHTYRNLFKELGGEELYLVPSLNSSDTWCDALESIIANNY
ncbi:MAG: ferrochelatase [Gammaproteobacteria bacterium]|nr:ferrochelatase [Gammaproteobacteria bacterium]